MTPQIHAEQAPASATFTQVCVSPCEAPLSEPVGQRPSLELAVERLHAIRALAAEADLHYDRYAETGCLAALGDAHRLDAQMERLLDEGRSA